MSFNCVIFRSLFAVDVLIIAPFGRYVNNPLTNRVKFALAVKGYVSL